jgi:DNA polymerase-3 subunit delta
MKEVTAIINDLKNRKFKPIYLLMGDEPYFIDQIADFAEAHILDESEKAFNQAVLYGRDINVNGLVSELNRFPMGAEHQVIILREAQDLDGLKKKDELEKLSKFIRNPPPSTIFVMCYKYGKLDGRSEFVKTAKKIGEVLETKKIYDSQVAGWIESELRNRDYKVSPKAAQLLGEFLGTDLGRIATELTKLEILVPKGGEITAQVIERNVGISKDYNIFELNKAIGRKDAASVLKILNYFKADPKNHPAVVIFAQIYSLITKLMIVHSLADKSRMNVARELGINPFFADEYLSAIRNYNPANLPWAISFLLEGDAKIKGIEPKGSLVDDQSIVKETVFKIMAL